METQHATEFGPDPKTHGNLRKETERIRAAVGSISALRQRLPSMAALRPLDLPIDFARAFPGVVSALAG
jgi:hypothetical protein